MGSRFWLRGLLTSLLVLAGTIANAQQIETIIRLNSKVAMTDLAKSVTERTSHRYHQFYTAEEINAAVAPSAAEFSVMSHALQARGFQVISRSKDGLFVTVRADRSVYESNFGVRLQNKTHGLRHLSGTVSIPSDLPFVASVTGLDNSQVRHNQLIIDPSTQPSQTPPGLSPSTIQSYYKIDALLEQGYNGKGQDIAIATYDDVQVDNVNLYYLFNKISPMPVVDKVVFNGVPNPNEGSALETSLDAEFTGMMAPGASIHIFTSAENSDKGELEMFNAILDDGRAKVVNYSWGMCEEQLDLQHFADMETVLARAVAQGVNIMVASGDAGSKDCVDASNNPILGVDFPSANPNVVAVGGTSLQTYNGVTEEVAWSGGGGGFSTLAATPDYQKGLGLTDPHRSTPDVSFNADPNYGEAIYATLKGKQGFMNIGGTSMAAPQWTGFLALVNAARVAAGKKQLGFLNPIIYAMSADQLAAGFNDILMGSNGDFSAGPGWDPVSGWGSMKGANLFNKLVATP